MNRRHLLHHGSLASLSLLVVRSLPTALGQTRTPGANDRIRIGIIGFSDRLNSALLPAFLSMAKEFNCEIVGVSDLWSRRRSDAEAWFKKHTGKTVPTYRNNEELYEMAKPDAVIISTADFQHARHLVEGVTAGCDVYCEKPFAETMQDARAALKAAHATKKVIQIGSQRRSGDTIHWFTGLPHPRSVAANGGIYQWKDGRTNFDTLTAVFDYGPLDDPTSGFQVTYSSRFSNSAGGTKEIYYSNGGELNLATGEVTSKGRLGKGEAAAMGMQPNLLEKTILNGSGSAVTSANTGADPLTNAHMRNWLECLRSRKTTHAPVEAGYQHAIACIMANAAGRTGERVTFDEATQEVIAGGKVFHR